MCDACTDSTGGNGTGIGPFVCHNCHYDLVSDPKTNLKFLTVTLYTSTFSCIHEDEVILDGVDSLVWMPLYIVLRMGVCVCVLIVLLTLFCVTLSICFTQQLNGTLFHNHVE